MKKIKFLFAVILAILLAVPFATEVQAGSSIWTTGADCVEQQGNLFETGEWVYIRISNDWTQGDTHYYRITDGTGANAPLIASASGTHTVNYSDPDNPTEYCFPVWQVEAGYDGQMKAYFSNNSNFSSAGKNNSVKTKTFGVEDTSVVVPDIDASISISRGCENDEPIERFTVALTGISAVTITWPDGTTTHQQTAPSSLFTGQPAGIYKLSGYQLSNGYKTPDNGLPSEFVVAACPEKAINPFVRITYICQADIDGTVAGYNIDMNAGEHLWRIRHEKDGPATAFSTNFLSDVQGFINVGETLLFATPQNANGVKVITTPLPNDYKGTASVSNDICTMEDKDNALASVTIDKLCKVGFPTELITISFEGITTITITAPDPADHQTFDGSSPLVLKGLPEGVYQLEYVLEDGFEASTGSLPAEFTVEAGCAEKEEPQPTPEPTIAPTTGSPDSFIGMIAAASSALLISGTSFTLWFKKHKD